MKVKRFNRHDIFDGKDRTLVLDMIGKTNPFNEVSNMLYGLFDGYWYDSLLTEVGKIKEIPSHMVDSLKELLTRVQTHIDVNGQTYTQV